MDLVIHACKTVGRYTQEQKVDSLLAECGLSLEDLNHLCSEFSCGWRMIIALVKLLLSQHLDEPSNHSYASARNWLVNYLANYDRSLILVPHDLAMLEKSLNNIAEVAGKTLLKFVSCNYSKYLEEKEFHAKGTMVEYKHNIEEVAQLQAFVNQFSASETKAALAQC